MAALLIGEMIMRYFLRFTVPSLMLCANAPVMASVTEYLNKQQWQAAAGQFTTIPFTGFPDGTLITNQYTEAGVIFTDGSDFIFLNNSFPNDGAGLYGAIDEISVSFSQPMTSIAVDYPGWVRIKLYYQQHLIYTSINFPAGGAGNFGGLISTEPFDFAWIIGPLGEVNIDDLHFGPPIPAPGGLGLFALTLFAMPRRRRSNYR